MPAPQTIPPLLSPPPSGTGGCLAPRGPACCITTHRADGGLVDRHEVWWVAVVPDAPCAGGLTIPTGAPVLPASHTHTRVHEEGGGDSLGVTGFPEHRSSLALSGPLFLPFPLSLPGALTAEPVEAPVEAPSTEAALILTSRGGAEVRAREDDCPHHWAQTLSFIFMEIRLINGVLAISVYNEMTAYILQNDHGKPA